MRKAASVTGLLIVWLAVNPGLWSQDNDRTKLAKAVAEAKVSLDQGLSASTQVGKPISAKFEIEDGELQLSVYTAKGNTFAEVVVDTETEEPEESARIIVDALERLGLAPAAVRV